MSIAISGIDTDANSLDVTYRVTNDQSEERAITTEVNVLGQDNSFQEFREFTDTIAPAETVEREVGFVIPVPDGEARNFLVTANQLTQPVSTDQQSDVTVLGLTAVQAAAAFVNELRGGVQEAEMDYGVSNQGVDKNLDVTLRFTPDGELASFTLSPGQTQVATKQFFFDNAQNMNVELCVVVDEATFV